MQERAGCGVGGRNLIDDLLSLPHGDEVRLTATLAWFFEASPPLRAAVLDRIAVRLEARGAPIPRLADGSFAEPEIATEVWAPHPERGSCRYDLVLDWYEPRLRVIVEVKVWAPLTMHAQLEPMTEVTTSVDQLQRYLDVAAHDAGRHFNGERREHPGNRSPTPSPTSFAQRASMPRWVTSLSVSPTPWSHDTWPLPSSPSTR